MKKMDILLIRHRSLLVKFAKMVRLPFEAKGKQRTQTEE